ncbi:MAG: biotin/lipoyl-binding protein, partial [Chloroflexia bacterium]
MKRIAYLLPILLALAGCKKEEAFVRPVTPVKLQAVERETPDEGPRYSGTVEPASRSDLAFRLGGYIDQVHRVGDRLVYEGDRVAKGTVLARVRESDYQAKVAQATSQVDQAKAALVQTEEGVRGAKVGRDKAKGDFDRAT